MTSNLQNCTDIIPLLDAYHDGELTEEEKVSVDSHLRGCETCSSQLADVGHLVSKLKGLPVVSLRENFSDRFDQLLHEPAATAVVPMTGTDSKLSNVVRGNFPAKFGWIAAAASFVVLLGVQQYTSHQDNRIAQAPNAANSVSKTLQKEQLAQSREQIVANLPESSPPVIPDASLKVENQLRATATANSPAASVDSHNASDVTLAHKFNRKTEVSMNESSNLFAAPVTTASATPIVAATSNSSSSSSSSSPVQSTQSAAPKHSLVAYYEPETNSIPEELGISTDEDGLYAIKM